MVLLHYAKVPIFCVVCLVFGGTNHLVVAVKVSGCILWVLVAFPIINQISLLFVVCMVSIAWRIEASFRCDDKEKSYDMHTGRQGCVGVNRIASLYRSLFTSSRPDWLQRIKDNIFRAWTARLASWFHTHWLPENHW